MAEAVNDNAAQNLEPTPEGLAPDYQASAEIIEFDPDAEGSIQFTDLPDDAQVEPPQVGQQAPQEGVQEGQQGEGQQGEGQEDTVYRLADGSEVPLSELADSYVGLRQLEVREQAMQADQQAFVDQAQAYQEAVQFQQALAHELGSYLESIVPPQPDIALMQTDPVAYNQAVAIRNETLNTVQGIKQRTMDGMNASQQVQEQNIAKIKAAEDQKLTAHYPTLRNPSARAQFDQALSQTAQHFGFTQDEFSNMVDHRALQVLAYAHQGLMSERQGRQLKQQARTVSKPTRRSGIRGKSVSNQAAAGSIQRFHRQATLDNAAMVPIAGFDD